MALGSLLETQQSDCERPPLAPQRIDGPQISHERSSPEENADNASWFFPISLLKVAISLFNAASLAFSNASFPSLYNQEEILSLHLHFLRELQFDTTFLINPF